MSTIAPKKETYFRHQKICALLVYVREQREMLDRLEHFVNEADSFERWEDSIPASVRDQALHNAVEAVKDYARVAPKHNRASVGFKFSKESFRPVLKMLVDCFEEDSFVAVDEDNCIVSVSLWAASLVKKILKENKQKYTLE